VATDRLYFADAYLTAFDARVVAREERDGRAVVALDKSAFYPEGGGQPPDHGTLNGVPVTDVQVDDDGVVWHTIESELAGDAAQGVVNWKRRFDHMQQHHGQHLLSAAFEELFGAKTISFHLGAEYASIDLAGDVTAHQARAAEERTNEVIWEDHPVRARFVGAEELPAIPFRKLPEVEGPIRVVSVDGFDHSACGGTHPRTTGGVGILHVRRREKRGADTRVEFLCGGRVLHAVREQGALLGRLAASFTVGVDELENAVTRLRAREEEARARLGRAVGELLSHDARRLVADAARVGGTPVVQVVRDDLSLDEGRTLAREITAAGAIAIIGLAAGKPQLLVVRPHASDVDCGKLVRDVLARFGGRGGGQPAAAQGGVPDVSQLQDAVAAAAEAMPR